MRRWAATQTRPNASGSSSSSDFAAAGPAAQLQAGLLQLGVGQPLEFAFPVADRVDLQGGRGQPALRGQAEPGLAADSTSAGRSDSCVRLDAGSVSGAGIVLGLVMVLTTWQLRSSEASGAYGFVGDRISRRRTLRLGCRRTSAVG